MEPSAADLRLLASPAKPAPPGSSSGLEPPSDSFMQMLSAAASQSQSGAGPSDSLLRLLASPAKPPHRGSSSSGLDHPSDSFMQMLSAAAPPGSPSRPRAAQQSLASALANASAQMRQESTAAAAVAAAEAPPKLSVTLQAPGSPEAGAWSGAESTALFAALQALTVAAGSTVADLTSQLAVVMTGIKDAGAVTAFVLQQLGPGASLTGDGAAARAQLLSSAPAASFLTPPSGPAQATATTTAAKKKRLPLTLVDGAGRERKKRRRQRKGAASSPPAPKVVLQLLPQDLDSERAVGDRGFNPRLELTVKATKAMAGIVEHVTRKWGVVGVTLAPAGGAAAAAAAPAAAAAAAGGCWTADSHEATAGDAAGPAGAVRLEYRCLPAVAAVPPALDDAAWLFCSEAPLGPPVGGL